MKIERKYKFLYLDDNDKVFRDGDVELLNTLSDRIEVTTDYPSSWSKQSKRLVQEVNDGSIEGLILDWELTNNSVEAKEGSDGAEDIDFSAESIAEHLRVNAAKELKDIPIILCSADKNNSFTKHKKLELTSRDLFDLTFDKKELFDSNVESSERMLYDLGKSYKLLQRKAGKSELIDLLCITDGELGLLDIRFVDSVQRMYKSKTVHDFIQFLLRDFIECEGILIDDRVLAARLGVDIDNSKDWKKLKQILVESNISYSGILSKGWDRSWAFKLEEWWYNKISKDDLRTMKASNRVNLLKESLGLDIIAADKIKFCTSDEFWTVCFGSRRPIDPANGFLVANTNQQPWLENKYVSGLAELEKNDKKGWRIDVVDRDNYSRFKSLLLGIK